MTPARGSVPVNVTAGGQFRIGVFIFARTTLLRLCSLISDVIAPIVGVVQGCTDLPRARVVCVLLTLCAADTINCPQNGSVRITINGESFGPGPAGVSVTVGGSPCTTIQMAIAHFQLTCIIPPGDELNRVVLVTIGGQSGSRAALSYFRLSKYYPVTRNADALLCVSVRPRHFSQHAEETREVSAAIWRSRSCHGVRAALTGSADIKPGYRQTRASWLYSKDNSSGRIPQSSLVQLDSSSPLRFAERFGSHIRPA